jgi:hypothetical protein
VPPLRGSVCRPRGTRLLINMPPSTPAKRRPACWAKLSRAYRAGFVFDRPPFSDVPIGVDAGPENCTASGEERMANGGGVMPI